MERTTVSSGTDWESRVGYSRAVRVGPHVHVSGTTATDDDGDVIGDDAYEQTAKALENVESALTAAGTSLDAVVRTRLYVVDIDEWELIGRAHAETFGEIRPTTSMIEVCRLIDPAMLVEVEAVAIEPGE